MKTKKKNDFIEFMEEALFVLVRIMSIVLVASLFIIGLYEMPNIAAWDGLTDGYTCVMGNFYVNSAYSVDEASMMNEFIETLPPAFKKEFKSNWRVIVEDYYITPTGNINDVILGGYADWRSRVILIKKQTDPVDTLDIFVHEIGHCFDFEYGSVSFSNEFVDIYDLYKDNFSEEYNISPDGYATSTAEEFFAACFKEYLMYSDHLKTVAPKAYDYLDHFYKDVQEIKYIYVYDLGAVANTIARLTE